MTADEIREIQAKLGKAAKRDTEPDVCDVVAILCGAAINLARIADSLEALAKDQIGDATGQD